MLSWFESNLTPAHQQQLYNCPAALLRERRKYGGTDRNSSKNKKIHRAKTNMRSKSRSSPRLSRGELRLLSNFVNKPWWSKITPKHLASLHCSISVIANLRALPLESEVGLYAAWPTQLSKSRNARCLWPPISDSPKILRLEIFYNEIWYEKKRWTYSPASD